MDLWEQVTGKQLEANDRIEKLVPKQPASIAVHLTDPQAPRVRVNADAMFSLFEGVQGRLVQPRLKVPVLEPRKRTPTWLVLYLTGDKSHAPGSLGIVTGERIMLATVYRAKMTEPGSTSFNKMVWYPATYTEPVLQQSIKQLLENPDKEMAIRGKEIGQCCYCGRGLENASSVYHGYGPVCAEKWGLPWGDVAPDKILQTLTDEDETTTSKGVDG